MEGTPVLNDITRSLNQPCLHSLYVGISQYVDHQSACCSSLFRMEFLVPCDRKHRKRKEQWVVQDYGQDPKPLRGLDSEHVYDGAVGGKGKIM